MLVENQKVEVRWNNFTKKHYIEKGYKYTKNGDVFIANVEDIQHGSTVKVKAICDYCGNENYVQLKDYYNHTKENSIKYACKKCCSIKRNEYRNRNNYFKLFLDACFEHNCIPISTINDYINAYTKLKYICPFHGLQEITYVSIYSGSWCNSCGFESSSKKNALCINEVISRVESKNNNKLINPEDYKNHNASNLRVLCGSCGREFITSLSSIENGNGACLKCANKKTSEQQKLSSEEVKKRIESVNNNILLNPEDYKDNHTPNLKIKCGDCGKIYVTTLANYEYNQKIRCDECSQRISVPERQVMKLLDDHHIDYKYNHRFDDCKGKYRALPFDFYVENLNVIIETDGRHHYYPVWGEEHHQRTKSYDKIKNEYCKNKNIRLIRIPFWNFNNIETILTKELNLSHTKQNTKIKYISNRKIA